MNKNVMISYSQNFEDVILRRVLQNVTDGFYIDIGAAHPVYDSVTYHFYNAGWSGINIDPLEKNFIILQSTRPRDINLNVAVADFEGTVKFFESEVDGWSTTVPEVAKNHFNLLGISSHEKDVQALTLNQICQEYVKNRDIHFLKIDVEGGEERVLLGLDLIKYRPWILLIEATLPNSQVEVFEDWESLVLEQNYKFIYSDGLNRFYLAEEKSHLSEFFKYPPNVFDNFIKFNAIEPSVLDELLELREQIRNISDSKLYKVYALMRRFFH
jgi:FkbM family methyltransferase